MLAMPSQGFANAPEVEELRSQYQKALSIEDRGERVKSEQVVKGFEDLTTEHPFASEYLWIWEMLHLGHQI